MASSMQLCYVMLVSLCRSHATGGPLSHALEPGTPGTRSHQLQLPVCDSRPGSVWSGGCRQRSQPALWGEPLILREKIKRKKGSNSLTWYNQHLKKMDCPQVIYIYISIYKYYQRNTNWKCKLEALLHSLVEDVYHEQSRLEPCRSDKRLLLCVGWMTSRSAAGFSWSRLMLSLWNCRHPKLIKKCGSIGSIVFFVFCVGHPNCCGTPKFDPCQSWVVQNSRENQHCDRHGPDGRHRVISWSGGPWRKEHHPAEQTIDLGGERSLLWWSPKSYFRGISAAWSHAKKQPTWSRWVGSVKTCCIMLCLLWPAIL